MMQRIAAPGESNALFTQPASRMFIATDCGPVQLWAEPPTPCRTGTSYATVGVLPGSMKLVPIQGEADFSREDLANRQKILNGFVMRGRLGDR